MSRLISMFQTQILRAIARRNYLFMILVMTLLTIFMAVYFTSEWDRKERIAVVTKEKSFPIHHQDLHIEILEKVPPTSKLLMNQYDAVLVDQGEGKFYILTLKSRDYKSTLKKVLANPETASKPVAEKTGVGVTLLGYLTLFVLLEGLMFMIFFTEDKQNRTFLRTVTTPAGISRYFLVQSLFTFMILYVPTFLLLVMTKEGFGFDIGFSYGKYGFLLALLSLLSTSFALFMTAIVEKSDNNLSFSASLVVLTSLLSGSFYPVQQEGFMERLTYWLPQKRFLDLTMDLEQQTPLWDHTGEISYLLCICLILLSTGITLCTRRFREGRYG